MTRIHRVASPAVVALFLVAAGLSAQTGATTLAAMSADSAHVAHARVLSVNDGALRRVVFRTLHVVAGTPPETFVLEEPAGGACGRALAGIAPGAGYVVFLAAERRLAFASSRAIVALEPGLIEHVRALRATSSAAPRVELLADALRSPSARVRADAALSLATCPGLERAGASTASKLRDRLRAALEAGESSVVLPLATAASRTGDPDTLDVLVEHWIRGGSGSHEPLLRRAILRYDHGVVARRFEPVLRRGDAVARRATALVGELHGVREKDPTRPRFRSIRPEGARR